MRQMHVSEQGQRRSRRLRGRGPKEEAMESFRRDDVFVRHPHICAAACGPVPQCGDQSDPGPKDIVSHGIQRSAQTVIVPYLRRTRGNASRGSDGTQGHRRPEGAVQEIACAGHHLTVLVHDPCRTRAGMHSTGEANIFVRVAENLRTAYYVLSVPKNDVGGSSG